MHRAPSNHRTNAARRGACMQRAASGSRGARGHRAFTLLEALLVAGAIVAIAAVAYPLYTPMLERQDFESAVEEAVAQCAQARATAQERGVAVEVVVLGSGTRLETRAVDLLADADDGASPDERFHVDGMDQALRGSPAARKLAAERERAIDGARNGAHAAGVGDEGATALAHLDLSEGIAASIEAPIEADERPEFNASIDGRVALFLPDGSATAVRGFWVVAGPRAARVEINPLLGHAVRRDVTLVARKAEALGGE